MHSATLLGTPPGVWLMTHDEKSFFKQARRAVSLEQLIGQKAAPAKRGPAPKLQQQIERIKKLPRAKQRLVMEMLDTVIQQVGR